MRYLRLLSGVLIGALVGLAIGYFGKCASGTCPLTSDPLVSMVLGGLIGGMLAVMK